MAIELNRFLTSLDASFLYLEKPTETMHIGGTMVYEGQIHADDVIRLLEERLPEIPRYRQKVVFPPLGISHPIWCDDPNFDIRKHVDEVELDGKADDKALALAAAEAYRGMLPRDRPLWHATLIRGLADGSTAIVWKIHHAMIDGVSGVDLTLAMNDLSENPTPRPQPPAWDPQPVPDAISLAQESTQHRLTELAQVYTDSLFGMFRPSEMLGRGRKIMDALSTTLPTASKPAPKTPFNAPVSGKIAYAWADFSFTEMRKIKSEIGGTLNDLVLTVLSGGLARYLDQRGEEIEADAVLRAMCPVSMRASDEHGQLGNLVSVMLAPLPIHERDCLERHARVRAGMDNLKEVGQAEALYDITKLSQRVPPLLQALASRLPVRQSLLNTVSTNVPGPQIPLYQGGHRLLRWLPMGILSNNIGLFVAILTYNRRMVLGFTVDPELVPDPWQVTEAIYASQAELREAAGVEPYVDFELDQSSGEGSEAKPAPAAGKSRSKKTSAKKAKSSSAKAAKKATRKKTTRKKAKRASASKKAGKKAGKKVAKRAAKKKTRQRDQSVA